MFAKKIRIYGILVLFFAFFAVLFTGSQKASAQGTNRDVYLHNKDNITPADYDREYFCVGDHGYISFARDLKTVDYPGAPSSILGRLAGITTEDEYKDIDITYSIDNEDVLMINSDRHIYQILSGGEATVILTAKIPVEDPSAPGGVREETWLAKFTFIVMGDASGVMPENEIVITYMVYDSVGSADVALLNCPNLQYYSFDYSSSNGDMCVQASFDPWSQVLHLESSVEGISEVTVLLNGSPIRVTLDNRLTSINTDRHIMDIGDEYRLSIDQFNGTVKWKSMDKSIATVSKNGKVTGKSIGNTVIYAQVGGSRIGCAVSVVEKGHTEVVEAATQIGATCSYSQPMRMMKGYYDCSSLVWMAYAHVGQDFGLKEFAPTAASEALWCEKHHKILGEWTYEAFQNMEYLPGDLLFRVGADNGRYLGIYHVEMFAGYRVTGFDESGEPVLSMCWANRPENYYEPCGDIFGRP